jgi:hypothetical protein
MQKMLFIENKAYFLERLHLILWKIDPFVHKAKIQDNNWHIIHCDKVKIDLSKKPTSEVKEFWPHVLLKNFTIIFHNLFWKELNSFLQKWQSTHLL